MILVEEIFVKSSIIFKSCMKNVNMLFNNKLPTALYTTFQIIKLLIKKGNLNLIQQKLHINIIHQISSIQTLPTYQNPYTRMEKNSYMISFYTKETSYMKWKTNNA